MNFVILNSPFFPVPRTHYLHIKKLALGFSQLGYYVIETDNLDSLLKLSENDMVYISNHFYVDIYYRFSRKLQLNYLRKVLDKLTCKVLLWNFHTVGDGRFTLDQANILYLTEAFYQDHFKEGNLSFYKKVKFYQLLYASYVNDQIQYPLAKAFKYDFNYVGSPYNMSILDRLKKDNRYKTFIKITPPIVNEIERVNSFFFSKINLVFHSSENKRKGIITERFAEAMSSGNIILHDNERILQHIPSLPGCLYVKSYQDVVEIYERFQLFSDRDILDIVDENRQYWKSSPFVYRKQALAIHNLFD